MVGLLNVNWCEFLRSRGSCGLGKMCSISRISRGRSRYDEVVEVGEVDEVEEEVKSNLWRGEYLGEVILIDNKQLQGFVQENVDMTILVLGCDLRESECPRATRRERSRVLWSAMESR